MMDALVEPMMFAVETSAALAAGGAVGLALCLVVELIWPRKPTP